MKVIINWYIHISQKPSQRLASFRPLGLADDLCRTVSSNGDEGLNPTVWSTLFEVEIGKLNPKHVDEYPRGPPDQVRHRSFQPFQMAPAAVFLTSHR